MKALIALAVLFTATMLSGIVLALWDPWYADRGIEKIEVGGQTLYLKLDSWPWREERGWITANPDPCAPADEGTDYIISTFNPYPLYAKVENGKLILYNNSIRVPARGGGMPPIEIRNVHPLDNLPETFQTRGLRKMEVPHNVTRLECSWLSFVAAK